MVKAKRKYLKQLSVVWTNIKVYHLVDIHTDLIQISVRLSHLEQGGCCERFPRNTWYVTL